MYGFVYSKEFQENPLSNVDYVTAMYRVILGREPDKAGLSSWVKILEDGATRKKVLEGFLNSPEMTALCEALGIDQGKFYSDELVDRNVKVTAFVTRLYKFCLGRAADIDGLAAWAKALNEKASTSTKVVKNFFNSTEFIEKNLSNEEFVTTAYKVILDREPDAAGAKSWIKALDDGASRQDVILGFAQSVEFENLCQTYGIRPN